MSLKISKLFYGKRQFRLFLVLVLSTIYCLALVGIRLYYTEFDFRQLKSMNQLLSLRGSPTFFFLIWNLFLAWIPFLIAITLEDVYAWTKSKTVSLKMLVAWLLFFPNAPYIMTDLLHLSARHPIPFWYDLMLFVSFAWTGLLLGLLSLHKVHLFLRKNLKAPLSWLLITAAIVLCSFGIYLGRCLRWNSWDILTSPLSLFQDVFLSMADSMAIKITLVFSGFLLLGYLTLHTLIGKSNT